MEKKLIKNENGEAKFTLVISADELEQGKIEVYKRSKDQFVIDGFRKGKAPRGIIERKYGENVFLSDAIDDILHREYPAAIKELGIEPIDIPQIDFEDVKKGEDLEISITVATYPQIEIKGYKGVVLDKVDTEVTEEDINTALEADRSRNARIISVDREVKEGDTVILDYKGFVGDEQFAGGTAENHELKIGSGQFIPGFEEQLIGAKKEEEVDVKVTFPTEYHAPDLAGKEAVFKCLIHEVKEEELPELDDEFAQDISEFDTLEEYKKDLVAKMQESKTAWAESQMREKAIESVIEANELEAPKPMIEDELNAMIRDMEAQLGQSGINMDMYLSMLGRDINQLKEEMKPDAEKRVKARMVTRGIIEAENIEASEQEVEDEIANLAKLYNLEVEQVKGMLGENLDFLSADIKSKKAIQFIVDNAEIK